MSPGTYLTLRRKAAGFTLDDVAARMTTDPRWPEHARAWHLGLIESDTAPASFSTILALRGVYRFDLDVLAQLDLAAQLPADRVAIPDICTKCGCSEADPCLSAEGNCGWADATYSLCDHCADHIASPPASAIAGAAA
jgi:transcriptional regulator with XRE-family HTH domain